MLHKEKNERSIKPIIFVFMNLTKIKSKNKKKLSKNRVPIFKIKTKKNYNKNLRKIQFTVKNTKIN